MCFSAVRRSSTRTKFIAACLLGIASSACSEGESRAPRAEEPWAPALGLEADSLAPGALAVQPGPRLFFLDLRNGEVLSADVTGENLRKLVTGQRSNPDGIAVDVAAGHVYWTTMGLPGSDDGAVMRAKLDGSGVTTIVPRGGTFTAKQLTIDVPSGMLYWSDREGMRIMRCKLDGSSVETLVTIAQGSAARANAKNWAVGIAVDVAGGFVYWTQKGPDNAGQGSIRRAPLARAAATSSDARTDVETLFDGLPEPIDLAIDVTTRTLYWTDRGDNTVNRASLDLPSGATAKTRTDRQVLMRGLQEAIGLSLDRAHEVLYYTDLGGSGGSVRVDGSNPKRLLKLSGQLTGITYVELP